MPNFNVNRADTGARCRPTGTNWFERLGGCPSVEAMRAALEGSYPGLARRRLGRLAVLGAAEEGERLVRLCARHGLDVVAVCDDNPEKHGLAVAGHRVAPVETLAALDRSVPVVVASHRLLNAVERLRGMGFDQAAPFAVLQILHPDSFPPHMFYAGWLEDLFENRDKYTELFNMLADEESRRTLDAIIGFRLTLDPAVLRPVIDRELYDPKGLLSLTETEVYVDAGAYDGDTVRLFIERVGGRFSRILAFEPDPASYERLAADFADDLRVEAVNKGLHRRSALLRFDSGGTRGSLFSEEGAGEVPVVSLDEVLGEDRVTFIKMNIEGAELNALKGAGRTIAKWAPRLAISAYHRPGDLWRVPFLILELRPKYRLYLRQHDGGAVETVAYAL